MRLHRFYIPELIGSRSEISVASAELSNQLVKVFRLKTGDKVILFDGSGSDYECEIAGSDKKSVSFRVTSQVPSRYIPRRKVFLCAAIVKKDNFEFIVEKATELGITDIIPVLAERSEKKALNEERLAKIAIEASEQSGRGSVPKIHAIASLEKSIEILKSEVAHLVAFDTSGDIFTSSDIARDASVGIFIGPEGGWSLAELELFHKHGVHIRCLGPQVLRAETAAVSALSVVMLGR